MKKKWIYCLLGIAVIGTLLTGCGKKTGQKNDKGVVEMSVADESSEDTEETVKTDTMEIETEYGTLYYPEQWKDSLEVEQTEKDEALHVTFQAKIDEKNYTLFEIIIGKGDGEPVGSIQDADGKMHDVYVNTEEKDELKKLSDEEQNRFYAMKEGINEVLDHLTD